MNQKISLVIILFLFILIGCSSSHGQEEYSGTEFSFEIKVDPAVELFCTIHRLANTHQYTTNSFPAYINDVENYFDDYKHHGAVKLAIQQRNESRINGSAPVSLAVYLNSPPLLSSKNKLFPSPDGLDYRWTENEINEFTKAARSFSETTAFMDFFNSHRALYKRSINNLYNHIKNDSILSWFERYFGYQAGKYTIILGMQNGNGNYGLTVTHRDSTKEYIALIGASADIGRKTPQFNANWIIPTIVHEFCHSYINPLVNKNYSSFEPAAVKIFKTQPPRNYYSSEIMMYEYLVRACTIRYFNSKDDKRTIKRRFRIDKQQGFPAIEELVELLDKYEQDRELYKTFSDFIPEIESFFNTYADEII